MKTTWLCMGAGLALVITSGTVMAGHGRVGLWSVTTNMDMKGMIPPDVAAQMKAMGIAMPSTQSVTSQICMTQADVDSSAPPPAGDAESGCTTKLVSQTPSSVRAQMVCTGKMKGTGQMQVSYQGTDRYTGSFSFKGTMEGNPADIAGSYQGQWLRANCGNVKSYSTR